MVARQAHNLKAAGSNPAPATNFQAKFGQTKLAVSDQLRKLAAPNLKIAIQRSAVVERSAVNLFQEHFASHVFPS
jgi:hypothetical protein